MHLVFPAEAVIFFLMGVFFAVASTIANRNQRRRTQQGVLIDGHVVALTPSRQLYTPTVRFTTLTGSAVEVETESLVDAGQLEIGQAVQVRYEPANPENADLASAKPTSYTYGLVIGLILLAVGVLQMLGMVPVYEQYVH